MELVYFIIASTVSPAFKFLDSLPLFSWLQVPTILYINFSKFSRSLQFLFLTWQHIYEWERKGNTERGAPSWREAGPPFQVSELQLFPPPSPHSELHSSFTILRRYCSIYPTPLPTCWSGSIIMEIIRINVIFSRVLLRIGNETSVMTHSIISLYTEPPHLSSLLT